MLQEGDGLLQDIGEFHPDLSTRARGIIKLYLVRAVAHSLG